MKNLNTKAFIYVLVVPSVMLWALLLLRYDVSIQDINSIQGIWEALRLIPPVITVDLVAWLLFRTWAWKFFIFQGWLVPFPVLQGTWQGQLQSTWSNPDTGKTHGPIPVILVIKQSFLTTSAVMHSQEMESRSFSAEFLVDRDAGSKKLVYSYTSIPKVEVRERSRVHDGTTSLTVKDNPERKLDGEYWTNRKSTGDISLKYRTYKLLQDFPEDLIHSSSSISSSDDRPA